MAFYENFLQLCNKAGKTPSRVLLEIGGTKSAVTRWKNGGQPTDATVKKIAEYFDVPAAYLLRKEEYEDALKRQMLELRAQGEFISEAMDSLGIEKPPAIQTDGERFKAKFNSLSDESKKVVEAMIDALLKSQLGS